MFNQKKEKYEKFQEKIWLSTLSMYPDSMCYVMEVYETNWMPTVGANKIKKMTCEKVECKYAVALSAGTAVLHMAVKLAGVTPGQRVIAV